MVMSKERTNFTNFLLMMFHWIMADAAVFLGFLFQLGFPKDPHPEIEPTIFSNKIFDLNIPMYIVGSIILIIGYFLIWKLWLREDWLFYKGQSKGFVVAGIVLEIINLLILFILFYLVLYLFVPHGMYGGSSRWVDYSIFGVWVVLILLPLWFFIKRKKADPAQ